MVYRYPKPVHVRPSPESGKSLIELILEKTAEATLAKDKDEAREERNEEEGREKIADAVRKTVREVPGPSLASVYVTSYFRYSLLLLPTRHRFASLLPLLATDAIQMGADEMRTDIRKVQRQFQGANGAFFEQMTDQMTAMLKMMEEASKKDVPANEVDNSGSDDK